MTGAAEICSFAVASGSKGVEEGVGTDARVSPSGTPLQPMRISPKSSSANNAFFKMVRLLSAGFSTQHRYSTCFGFVRQVLPGAGTA